MSKPRDSMIWGAILLLAGAGFLLWNLGALAGFETTLAWGVAALFALLGLGYVFSYLNQRSQWQRLIPAFTWFSVAAVIFLATRGAATLWVAVALLAGIALAFLVIYLSDRDERWWALIPCGAMVVMMAVILLSAQPEMDMALVGAALFGGMALVFFLIYALAGDRQRFGWALTPTAALGVMALAALGLYLPRALPALAEAAPFWPILVILCGVLLIAVAIMRSRAAKPAIELPPQPAAAEPSLVPGASVTTLTDDEPASRPIRYERSPITLVDETPSGPAAETTAGGEVPDIYEFLKNAPPEGKS